MKVTVKMGAPLSQVIGEKKVILNMPEGATLAEVLDELRVRYPDFEEGLKGKGLRKPFERTIYSVFVDARPVSFKDAGRTVLADGDRISLFLPVAGG
jgi:molybdopterin converting factor small subunit